MTANSSGYQITEEDVGLVIGMTQRGDRNHDIAAWFGVNQGRIKETKDGKFGPPIAAHPSKLPPRGAPGIKGRYLYAAIEKALKEISAKGSAGLPEIEKILENAKNRFEANEP